MSEWGEWEPDELERYSEETGRKIAEFNARWDAAAFGPAHIVLDDGNVGDSHLDWCMGLLRAVLAHRRGEDVSDVTKFGLEPDDYPFLQRQNWYEYLALNRWDTGNSDELEATLAFLQELRAIPEDDR